MRHVIDVSTVVMLLGILCLVSPGQTARSTREDAKLLVNHSEELWRLEWQSPPIPECGPEGDSLTCPCSGFAYGEKGPLDLVRTKGGKEIERLQLTPFFQEREIAIVQKWSTSNDGIEDFNKSGFADQIPKRPIVQIIHFDDYNRDGMATEFFLQTDVAPCGKTLGVVVGVSARNPKLHAFVSIAHPERPLVLQKREWVALLKSKTEITLVDWPCWDHGSETETELTLNAINGDISVVRKEYTCQEDGKRDKLLSSQPI